MKLFLDSNLINVHDNNKISSYLQNYNMTSVSLTIFFIAEINQNWNHNKVEKATNICFQQIIDIYKIILLITVKTETYILFLNLYLNSVVSWALKRMKKSSMTHQIEITCMIIRKKLCWKKQNHQIFLIIVTHFKSLLADWIQLWISNIKNI